ncbi:MAG: hypothetical protein EXR79_10375 [Myxococcales bacterium]|nr:hypothetical protein [Myxococcales bacterium]
MTRPGQAWAAAWAVGALSWACTGVDPAAGPGLGSAASDGGVIGSDGAVGDTAGAAGATDGAPRSDGGVGPDATARASDALGAAQETADAPGCSAEQAKKCADGLACTADACVAGVCQWTLVAGHCFVGGTCAVAGAANPAQACQRCDPVANAKAWSLAPDATACDDGTACSFDDACKGGKCGGQPVVCGDGNPCTADTCDKTKGCLYPPTLGSTACDDGSACSVADHCSAGQCAGKLTVCDDKNPCTDDACDSKTGCGAKPNLAPCSDGDACSAGDACQGGTCQGGPLPNCDDGNVCSLDSCEVGVGCYHLPVQSPCCVGQTSKCDDGKPCTNDLCDGSGCKHEPNTAPCDDGNACTGGDACQGGACTGTKAAVCDDKNPCTADTCTAKTGCQHQATGNGTACDDGSACTKDDKCTGGTCAGSGSCACTPVFSTAAAKLNTVLIGSGGKPGEGLDVDENPATCAPGDCSAGIDNALSALGSFANPQLDKAVQSGSLALVLELKEFKQGPINLALYSAKLDPKNATCKFMTESCAWRVDPKMLDPVSCKALVGLPGTLVGTQLKAGGKSTSFPFSIPLQGGAALKVTIYAARVHATVTLADGKMTALDGVLAGAVPKTELVAALDALPDDGSLPISKDDLKGLLNALVQNDIDLDGDGKKDAASIGLKLKGIAGTLAGTY